eukprot:1146978-Pelagomonas_calceolata.AAC.2
MKTWQLFRARLVGQLLWRFLRAHLGGAAMVHVQSSSGAPAYDVAALIRGCRACAQTLLHLRLRCSAAQAQVACSLVSCLASGIVINAVITPELSLSARHCVRQVR